MKEQIISFYQKQYSRMKYMHPRRMVEAIALLICQEVQLLSILLGNSNENLFTTFQAFQSVIRFTRLYTIVCWDTSDRVCLIYFQYFIAGLLIIVVALLMFLILRMKKQSMPEPETQSNKQFYGNKQQQIQQVFISKYHHGVQVKEEDEESLLIFSIKMVLSVFFQLFDFLFFQSFLYLTIKNQVNGFQQYPITYHDVFAIMLGFIIVPLLIIIFLFSIYHKTSYQFQEIDYLGMFPNKRNYILAAMNLLLIIVQIIAEELDMNKVNKIFAIIYYVFFYFVGSQYRLYLNQELQLFQNQFLVQTLLLAIVFTCQEFGVQNESNLIQFYVFIGPLFVKITQFIYNYHHKQVTLHHKTQNINGQTLDWQLRTLFWHSKQIFLNKRENFNQTRIRIHYSLLLYNMVSNHLHNCDGLEESKKSPVCFCKQYYPESNSDHERKVWERHIFLQGSELDESITQDDGGHIDEKKYQHFIMDYIQNQYEVFLKKRQIVSIEVNLSYIYFIIEILKIPTKAFVEALNLYKVASFNSLKSKMLIYQLLLTSRNKFKEFILKKEMKNQKFCLEICFQLDQSILTVTSNIFYTIELLKNWFELLINQKENLFEMQNKGQDILKYSDLIEDQLNQMFVANPLSSEVEQLYQIYYKYINIHQKRNTLYKKNSKIANEFVNSFNKIAFNKDSCVVSITLLQPLGKIRRFTNSFFKFSGATDRSELYTSITVFQPDLVAKNHNLYLQYFIETGRLDYINKDQRFLLVKTKEQFIVPIYAKIKLEDSYDDDFCVSAIISVINTPYHYILLNKYCLLEEIGQSIFNIFQQLLNCSVTQLRGIDFLQLIPQLLPHWENSVDENNSNFQSTRQSSSYINVNQSHLDVLLILPQNAKSIQQLLSKKLPPKRKPTKYFEMHKPELLEFFQKMENFHLFNLKVKINPIVTINDTIYILEVQSLKQFKKITLEDKLERFNQMINQVFPFQTVPPQDYVKQGRTNIDTQCRIHFQTQSADMANLDEFNFLEEDQMGGIITQNVSRILNTNTNSYRQKLLTLQLSTAGQCQTVGEVSQIELPSIPAFLQHQIENKEKDSITDEFTESSVPIVNEVNNDRNDINTMSSASQYQDQYAKRNLIKKMIFEKHSEQNYKQLFYVWRAIFLGILILSTAIFIMLLTLQSDSNDYHELFDVGQQSEAYNLFIIYDQCQEEEDLINCQQQIRYLFMNLSQSLNNITNEINTIDDISPCSQYYFKDTDIKLELTQIYNLMHNIINKDDDQSMKDLIENYFCYQEMFSKLDLSLKSQFQNRILSKENRLDVSYIIGITSILIFCVLTIPFQFFQERERIKILKLFQTLNSSQLTSQLMVYQNLLEFNQKIDQTQREYIIEDFLESSKSKFDMIESKHLVKRSFDAKVQISNSKFIVKKVVINNSKESKLGLINIPLKFFTLFAIFALLQSYFVISYLIYIDQKNNIDTNLSGMQVFDNLRQNFLLMAGQISLITTDVLKQNETFQNLFVTQVEENQLNIFNTETNMWQQLVKQIADDNNLLTFTTNNFCEIFELSRQLIVIDSDSTFSYQTCSNIPSLQVGFIILITSVGEYLDSIIASLSNGQITEDTLLLAQNSKLVIQTKSIFIIKALDILKDFQISSNVIAIPYFQIIIYSIYMAFIVLVYFFGLHYVKVQIFQNLEQSKKLLSLLPMELLLDNSYVMSFILTEQSRIQL